MTLKWCEVLSKGPKIYFWQSGRVTFRCKLCYGQLFYDLKERQQQQHPTMAETSDAKNLTKRAMKREVFSRPQSDFCEVTVGVEFGSRTVDVAGLGHLASSEVAGARRLWKNEGNMEESGSWTPQKNV